mgnify:CR=1 FL=1
MNAERNYLRKMQNFVQFVVQKQSKMKKPPKYYQNHENMKI